MIVFQTGWVILGGGLLRIGVQTPDYVRFIRLCMVLLQYVPLPPYVVHTQVFTRHSASHPLAFSVVHVVSVQ